MEGEILTGVDKVGKAWITAEYNDFANCVN